MKMDQVLFANIAKDLASAAIRILSRFSNLSSVN